MAQGRKQDPRALTVAETAQKYCDRVVLSQLCLFLWCKDIYCYFWFHPVLHFHSSARGEEGIIKLVFGLIWSTATLYSLQMIKTLPQKGTFILCCGV